MIKMNFKNQFNDDDERLIQLLKEQTMEFPSDELAENTMTRFLARQAEKKFVHKPLRTPLYLMIAIAFLLIVPFFMPVISNSVYLNSLSELLSYPVSVVVNYTVWCWLAVVVLLVSRLMFPRTLQIDFD